jgi:hypothetical protein
MSLAARNGRLDGETDVSGHGALPFVKVFPHATSDTSAFFGAGLSAMNYNDNIIL